MPALLPLPPPALGFGEFDLRGSEGGRGRGLGGGRVVEEGCHGGAELRETQVAVASLRSVRLEALPGLRRRRLGSAAGGWGERARDCPLGKF
jgi:hypothetical protein